MKYTCDYNSSCWLTCFPFTPLIVIIIIRKNTLCWNVPTQVSFSLRGTAKDKTRLLTKKACKEKLMLEIQKCQNCCCSATLYNSQLLYVKNNHRLGKQNHIFRRRQKLRGNGAIGNIRIEEEWSRSSVTATLNRNSDSDTRESENEGPPSQKLPSFSV